jgi:hypothetical protein
MPRGGHRDNAGRKSEWASSSQTRPIRVPDWMTEQVLEFARKLDNGEIIDNVHNQNAEGSHSEEVKNLKSVVQVWTDRVIGKETSPRWKHVDTLINEINPILERL